MRRGPNLARIALICETGRALCGQLHLAEHFTRRSLENSNPGRRRLAKHFKATDSIARGGRPHEGTRSPAHHPSGRSAPPCARIPTGASASKPTVSGEWGRGAVVSDPGRMDPSENCGTWRNPEFQHAPDFTFEAPARFARRRARRRGQVRFYRGVRATRPLHQPSARRQNRGDD